MYKLCKPWKNFIFYNMYYIYSGRSRDSFWTASHTIHWFPEFSKVGTVSYNMVSTLDWTSSELWNAINYILQGIWDLARFFCSGQWVYQHECLPAELNKGVLTEDLRPLSKVVKLRNPHPSVLNTEPHGGALGAEVNPGLIKVSGSILIDFSRVRISPFIFIVPEEALWEGEAGK